MFIFNCYRGQSCMALNWSHFFQISIMQSGNPWFYTVSSQRYTVCCLTHCDSTRISAVISLITRHTWCPDSFPPFILSKCSDSLQTVCFELSKRNQRHVHTWNKCYCKMSPAAHDMMNYNGMLISRSRSNGLFTRCSITNLLGLFSHVQIGILEEYTTALQY